MLPLFASSFIELTTFFLAIDDVNRLQLSFTCFLSFSFFISMLIDKLHHNSGHMSLLLISVGVMAGTVCILTILQAISYNLMTSACNPLMKTLKMTEEGRLKIAHSIDYIAIAFYLVVLITTQIFIPILISFAIEI